MRGEASTFASPPIQRDNKMARQQDQRNHPPGIAPISKGLPRRKVKKGKVLLISLGCPKNLVDSEVMLGLLQQGGYELTTDEEDADIFIVNTCSFIEPARQESIGLIRGLLESDKKLVVTGCLAQQSASELAAEFPAINAFVGTGEFHRIVEICDVLDRRSQIAVSSPQYLYDQDTPRILATPQHYAYLKIAEGCNNRCSFCIIPQLRGKYRSRGMDSLLAEARSLAEKGVRELILISQDSTYYGMDTTGERQLPVLLRELVKIEELDWIRILYTYPTLIDEELLAVMATEKKICRYLDIPYQHIHDDILRRMVRRTTSRELRSKLAQIKQAVPDITLRSTFIVGFPGETEDHFDALLAFLPEAEFDHLGVFAYSREENTPAAKLKGQLPPEVKEERVNRLSAVQRKIAFRQRQNLVGKALMAIVDGVENGYFVARHEGQAPEIDDVVYIKKARNDSQNQIGEFIRVKIVGTQEFDLIGEVIND